MAPAPEYSTQEALRDELYCQLLRQLSQHPPSERRGWQLLWLALGLFPPSGLLLKQLGQFLRLAQPAHALARECGARLGQVCR